MKLGKLLGVGKSFFGSDPMAAYCLNKRICLPKFNEGKNPFEPKTAPVAPEIMPVAPKTQNEASKGSGLTIAQAVAMAMSRKESAKPAAKPAAEPVMKAAAKPAVSAAVSAAAKPVRAGWTTKLNPFRAPEPEPQPFAVQAELSLDSVKVVHNDLSDADVEIVPVKSHAAAPAAAPVLQPARQAWEYLGENLLKSS